MNRVRQNVFGTGMHRRMKMLVLVLVLCVCSALLLAACGSDKAKEVGSIDDLTGARIGVQLGTTGDIYATDYEEDGAGSTVTRFNKGTDAVQALKQSKIDAVILDVQPAEAFVKSNSDLMILEEDFVTEDYAICIAKENGTLKEQINAALAELTREGVLDSIKKNYVGEEDVRGTTPYAAKDIERNNGTLIVATNAAFPPYEYYENGKITGLDVDMMQAVCDKLGMTLRVDDMEFDSIITAVQSGKATVGAAGMTVTEERQKNIDFTDSYTESKQVIIVKNPDADKIGASLVNKFKDNFIEGGRYKYLLQGLGNTLVITLFAVMIGIALGFVIAVIRTGYDRNGSLPVLNAICKLYLAIMRGTPVMVQLLIIYYVIFASVDVNKILIAVIAFGLNSAAYVAEIVRSGIMSVDIGQLEAGRSLGMNYTMTMRHVILPQAFKNVLPALGNEFIVLLKETSISGYIGLMDLTKGGDIIRSVTYEAFMPLIAVALIYFVIVMALSKAIGRLERRLKNSER